MRTFGLFCVTVAVAFAFGGPAAGDDPPPVATELKESVEVRLVIVDVIALDAKDRTVPDLTKADFKLFVDRKSAIYLDGTEIDFEPGIRNHGFKINNPNQKGSCGCGESVQF